MIRAKKIVAAVDRSPHAKEVTRYAIDLAARLGADLELLHIEVIYEEATSVKAAAAWQADVKTLLSAREASWLDVKYVTERALAPAPAIVEYAEDAEAAMLVIGTHGKRGFRRLMMGSVAQEVIRTAPCPVFSVSAKNEGHFKIEMNNRVLIPVDFSKYSLAALKYARELAETIGATYEIVHIVEDTFHPAFYGPFYQSVYDVIPDIEDVSRKNIVEMLDLTGGYTVQTKIHVFKGHPGRDIARFAEEIGSELIVMATNGLTGLDHVFMGSVSERTAQTAHCPVMTIHVDLLDATGDEPIVGAHDELAVV